MAEVADVGTDVEYAGRAHPLLHLLAPLVAAVAVWVARTGIGITYERVSGRKRPIPSDPETSWGQAIVWTAMTATTAAVIEVAVRRIANKRRVHAILRRGRAAGEVVTRRHGGPAGAAQSLRLGPGWRVRGARSGQRMPVSLRSTLKELADETSSS